MWSGPLVAVVVGVLFTDSNSEVLVGKDVWMLGRKRAPMDFIRPASAVAMLASLVWPIVAAAATPLPGESFRDPLRSGGHGPELIVVPAGQFLMGDLSGDGLNRERPVREVPIGQPFAIGKYEVTFEDYQRFLGSSAPPADEGWGRGNRPVINVSWTEAVEYVSWLSAETGQRYRLPSEAEWEYAARAGTTTAFSWGDEVGENLANCANCGSPPWGGKQSAPVGSFPANPWGLFDMHGNIWEWVRDCANENYDGAPSDGSPWEAGDCAKRMVRGGSFYFGAKISRSSNRFSLPADLSYSLFGFRVTRSLDAPGESLPEE